MIIKRMTAAFGRLSGDSLVLSPGLNIIEAPNEGGKSTWAGFLRCMLYGIPTRDRDKKGYLADKNRYQPWSGAPMEGELELTWRGRDITLRRFSRGGVPFGGFSAVYTGTEEPVPGLTGDGCGQTLLGVGRETFERSAFVGQGGSLAIDGSPELERRIAALFSSGEEGVSFSQAQARLREWQRRRRHNRSGLIPRLEEELARTGAALERAEQTAARLEQAQARLEALEETRRELELELHIHRRTAQRDLNRRCAQARADWEQARSELERLEADAEQFGPIPDQEALHRAQGELHYLKALDDEVRRGEEAQDMAEDAAIHVEAALKTSLFAGMTAEEAKKRGGDELDAYEGLLRERRRWNMAAPALMAAALVLLFLSMGASLYSVLFRLGFALCMIGCILGLNRARKADRRARQLLGRYRAGGPEEIERQLEDYTVCWTLAAEKREELRRLRESVAESRRRQEQRRESIFSFVHTIAPEVNTIYGCSAALSRALGQEGRLRECRERLELTRRRYDDLAAQGGRDFDTLELLPPPARSPGETEDALRRTDTAIAQAAEQLAMAKGELGALADPAVLAARQAQLKEQLERREREHQAISLALEALEEANARLQERFAPGLNRRAGEILSALTGGRYCGVSLSRDFEAAASGADGLLPRSTLALSRGTADQVYLAVRLAVCRLCLPEDDPAPLVLDDALTAFDDARMALALDFLAGLERQVLLFTCQKREGEYMRGREGVCVTGLHC